MKYCSIHFGCSSRACSEYPGGCKSVGYCCGEGARIKLILELGHCGLFILPWMLQVRTKLLLVLLSEASLLKDVAIEVLVGGNGKKNQPLN
eukprot:2555314-Amphidinium_carterae.1